MHRGVSNDQHHIHYINQDLGCARNYPPLWELVSESGKSVGICGCLQSYPPLIDQETIRFHIPDTFAPSHETKPDDYQVFQSINLRLTGENKAEASRLGMRDLMDGLRLFRSGITAKTGTKLLQQVASEKVNPLYRSVRATQQAHVAFDVFHDALKRFKPDYAAFFSNHVAGVMHRYWKYTFPADFGYKLSLDDGFDRFHSKSIVRAMDIFDGQLAHLESFANRNGYDLVIAASMGQKAVHREPYTPELKVDDASTLARAIGFPNELRMNLAMQPDIALEFHSAEALQEFLQLMPRLKDSEGISVLQQRYSAEGCTLNVSIGRSKVAVTEKRLFVDGTPVALDQAGLTIVERDPGTGYHQPEGVLIWRGAGVPQGDRVNVDSRRYAPTVLSRLGIPVPEYMMLPLF